MLRKGEEEVLVHELKWRRLRAPSADGLVGRVQTLHKSCGGILKFKVVFRGEWFLGRHVGDWKAEAATFVGVPLVAFV